MQRQSLLGNLFEEEWNTVGPTTRQHSWRECYANCGVRPCLLHHTQHQRADEINYMAYQAAFFIPENRDLFVMLIDEATDAEWDEQMAEWQQQYHETLCKQTIFTELAEECIQLGQDIGMDQLIRDTEKKYHHDYDLDIKEPDCE